ncbi:hypothetical protein D3C78_1411120 [compost metagenome]
MIQGPRTISSPEVLPSRGSSLPSSPTIFMSTPYTTRPCLACRARRSAVSMARCLALGTQAVPSGLSSVMPQTCSTCTSWRSWKAAIMDEGQAEPPITVRRMVEKVLPVASTWASRPCQTVGTPADRVTFSASNSSYSD